MSTTGAYRADIDGLRAVAILPVIFFHAGLPSFSGGFVGVDVFFVISGYLITRIIAREIDQGRFSILSFYERRARRILPALLAVIVFVLLGAAALYLPGDFESVPRSALAATLFVSNVTFFMETGYFQGGAETKPLLHTWSLAIEEQFYIGFPILLILIARYAPGWRAVIVGGIASFSLALAVWTQSDGDSFAFYLLPPRAWELFTGALLALRVVPSVQNRQVREIISVAGLGAIVFAVFSFDKHTIFPGLNALFPVLGTAALIHCAPGTLVARLLTLRAMVAVGLISYSLYLWHWPIIVFAEYAGGARLTGWSSLAALLISFAAAWASWKFIETPFRHRDRLSRRAVFGVSSAGMAAVCMAAGAMVLAGPWTSRFPAEVVRLANAKHDVSPHRARCHDSDPAEGRATCELGAGAPPSTILWGDSHGVELAFVLSEQARKEGRSLVQRTHSSCAPAIGYDPPELPRCAAANREVLELIRSDPRLGTVYLAAFWASGRYDEVLTGGALDRTIGSLTALGREVVLIGPIPSASADVPRMLASLAHRGKAGDAAGPFPAEFERHNQLLAKMAAHAGIRYVDAVAALCRDRTCSVIHDGRPLYFDSHHLSVAGAELLLSATLKHRVRKATENTSPARPRTMQAHQPNAG